MAATEFASIAEAEKILNRTLAYQAAITVHELKERLNLDVAELHLVVAPASLDAQGCYRVICTIESLASSTPVTLQAIVRPEQAVTPIDKAPTAKGKRQQDKSKQEGRARRSRR